MWTRLKLVTRPPSVVVLVRLLAVAMMLGILQIGTSTSSGQDAARVDDGGWRYTLETPADDWMKLDFADRSWTEASGRVWHTGDAGGADRHGLEHQGDLVAPEHQH
jgi:hypothetical protein